MFCEFWSLRKSSTCAFLAKKKGRISQAGFGETVLIEEEIMMLSTLDSRAMWTGQLSKVVGFYSL